MDSKETFIAHVLDDGQWQTIADHVKSVADYCEVFSCDLISEVAYCAGKLHDVGKYSAGFQQRIRGASIQVEHSLAGAVLAKELCQNKINRFLIQYVVLGHHTGLPDGGSRSDMDDMPTLQGRLKRIPDDYLSYQSDLTISDICSNKIEELLREILKNGDKISMVETFAFLTRYVFSCLTDADFLDTERFFNPLVERGLSADFQCALQALNDKIQAFRADTPVKKARTELMLQVTQNAESAEQINLVNMPTGSGKTLTSMKAALEIAIREGKKRIIYVIPYTSIIEQTALEFSTIFGEKATILQHHSNYDFSSVDDKGSNGASTAEKMRRAAENWDCPIVITTNVQFFESLYHYKGSRLRKMHNLANSIIVFDEVHMLPMNYLQPCIRAVGYITKYLDSKAIFLSATMPDYNEIFQKFIPDCTFRNLVSDPTCYEAFKNTTIHYIGMISLEALAVKAMEAQSVLFVTGTKKSARELYKLIDGKKYHLSTYMTPEHRTRVISSIKMDLRNQCKITVVSTSLIEAGVDLDFEVVFREIAGLESILQSAGRCNREGHRDNGDVFVYATEDKQKGELQLRGSIALDLMKKNLDVTREICIKEYFSRLYGFNSESISQNTIACSGDAITPLDGIPFREYAEKFKFIDNDTVAVVINKGEDCKQLLNKLRFGGLSAKRSLQKYSVGIRFYEVENALKQGLLDEVNCVYVLTDNNFYSEEYGLSLAESQDENYIFK